SSDHAPSARGDSGRRPNRHAVPDTRRARCKSHRGDCGPGDAAGGWVRRGAGAAYHEAAGARGRCSDDPCTWRSTLPALPGLRHAGLIEEVPGGGSKITTFEPVDHPIPRSVQPRAALRIVDGEYFGTMGIPVVAGRTFNARDRSDAPPVAVVSASFARLLARDGATVGRDRKSTRLNSSHVSISYAVF